MRLSHYIALACALGLIVILYYGISTVPPAGVAAESRGKTDAPHNGAPAMGNAVATPATNDSLYQVARKELPAHAKDQLTKLEADITAQKDSARMEPLFEEMASVWKDNQQFPMYAWYLGEAGHLAHSEKKLNFAGQLLLDMMQRQEASAPVQLWEAAKAIGYLNEALALNPENDTTKLALATGYIEGSDNPMQGIGILRRYRCQRPGNVSANLMLGRFSIQSGQYDKAIMRLETVLKQEPTNREATYFLAEAYKSKGDKAKAIALFEHCKTLVKDTAFNRTIDEYITSFR